MPAAVLGVALPQRQGSHHSRTARAARTLAWRTPCAPAWRPGSVLACLRARVLHRFRTARAARTLAWRTPCALAWRPGSVSGLLGIRVHTNFGLRAQPALWRGARHVPRPGALAQCWGYSVSGFTPLLDCARSPHFGVAHAMCLGLAPWLAAEVPHLVETGALAAKA